MELRSPGAISGITPRPLETPSAVATPSRPVSAAPVDSTEAVKPNQPTIPRQAVDDALSNINKTMQSLSQELEFSIDPDTDRTIVKVIDQRTQEVIRQMPTEEALEIAKALDRVQGLLIRQKA